MTIWVIERRVRRKGARWKPYELAMDAGEAKQIVEHYTGTAMSWRHDFRPAKYRRIP